MKAWLTICLLLAAMGGATRAAMADEQSPQMSAEQVANLVIKNQSHIWDLVDAYGTRLRSLTIEDAKRLLDDPFASAKLIATMRPTPKRELARIKLSYVDAETKETLRSYMDFDLLPGGLGYYTHDLAASTLAPAGHETAIDLFGLATVLYWNSRFSGDGYNSSKPDKISLVSGKVFTLTEPFEIDDANYSGSTISQLSCKPLGTPFSATSVNKDFTGNAAMFDCSMGNAEAVHIVYLEDTARYITTETSYDGKVASRTSVDEIVYK